MSCATAVLENSQHVDAFFFEWLEEEVVEILRTSCVFEANGSFLVEIVNKHIIEAFLPSGEVLFYFLLPFVIVKDVVIGNFLEHVVVKGKSFHSSVVVFMIFSKDISFCYKQFFHSSASRQVTTAVVLSGGFSGLTLQIYE